MPDESPKPLWSDAQQSNPYLVYDLRVNYFWDAGTLQLPVAYLSNADQTAAPDPVTVPQAERQPSAVIRVARPRGKKVVTFSLVRQGALPMAPNPTPQAPDEVLDSCQVENDAPQLQADGQTRLYRMRGVYVYNLSRPRYPTTDPLAQGTTPADTLAAADSQTSPGQFSPILV